MRSLVVAALQAAPVPGDPEATRRRFGAQVRRIKRLFPHVRLVLAPELHLSATDQLLAEPSRPLAENKFEIPGPLTEELAALARETGLWICPGSVYERAGGEIFNTAVVLSPEGELAATYRKCFPWQPYETVTPGSGFVVFDLPGIGRAGLAICYDGSFPETFRQLAWLGAEVVLHPTLTTTRDRDQELILARANAIFNQVYVVNVNSPGPHALGQSVIVDPEGLVRQQAGPSDEVLIDVLDLDAVTRVRTYGTCGLNRTWEQMDRLGPALNLPMYGAPARPRPVALSQAGGYPQGGGKASPAGTHPGHSASTRGTATWTTTTASTCSAWNSTDAARIPTTDAGWTPAGITP